MTALSDLSSALLAAVAGATGLASAHRASDAAPPDSARLPAATLRLRELSSQAGDELNRLARATFDLTLWRHDTDRQRNLVALERLADDVIDSVLFDPTQGGLAVAGPAGRATEVVIKGVGKADPPLACLALEVNCWVLPADELVPNPADQQVLIDDEAVFASGPHTLVVTDGQPQLLERRFGGLVGAIAIDLGPSSRTLTLTGRLIADDRDALLAQVAAVAALTPSACAHTVTAADGRSFLNVHVTSARWGRILSAGDESPACVGYQMQMTQMGA